MKLFFAGDVVGKPGRDALSRGLDRVRQQTRLDFVVANVENSAGGFGVTPAIADQFLEAGIDVLTSGNHIWDKKEILPYLADERRLLRPLNYPSSLPGSGSYVGRTPDGVPVAVLNLQGRVFMPTIDCPFQAADREVPRLAKEAKVILVDMHCDATSEKNAMGWYLDGRVSAVVGTHTHVPTADERVLTQGTAYITDVGMCGPFDSVIGIEKQSAFARFLTAVPTRFETAKGDPWMNAVIIDVDESTGKARSIERIQFKDGALATWS